MENKSFKRRYRGFKFFILALLVFTAVGLSYFATGPEQVDASRSGPEPAASSLRAQTGTPPLDPVDTAADGVDGAPSGTIPAQGLALPGAKIPLQPKSLQDPSVLSLTDNDSTHALERTTDRQTAAQGVGTAASDQAVEVASVSDAPKIFANQASVAKIPNVVTPAKTVDRGTLPSQQTTGATGSNPGAPLRCIGPPPKGKDLGSRYIVASCESLSIISQRTGVRIDDLKDHNPQIKNPDLIYPNQELRLPPRG